MLQPLAGWLGCSLRTPAPAVPALLRNLHRSHGSLTTQNRCARLVQRQPRKQCCLSRALHTQQSVDTNRVLELARKAAVQAVPSNSVVKVEGYGKQLGLTTAWQLVIGHDGACVQHVQSKELCFHWGTQGASSSSAWEEDDTGIPHLLQLDDNEALLVSEWVKSGAWLSPAVSELLDIQCLHEEEPELEATDMPQNVEHEKRDSASSDSTALRSRESLHQPQDGPSTSESSAAGSAQHGRTAGPTSETSRSGSAMPAGKAGTAGAAGNAGLMTPDTISTQHDSTSPIESVTSCADAVEQRQRITEDTAKRIEWEREGTNSSVSSTADTNRGEQPMTKGSSRQAGNSSQSQKQAYVVLAVKLKTGKILSQVRLCTTTWRPMALLQPVCGEVVTWHYLDWQEWFPDFHFPLEHHQLTSSGGNNSFITTSVKLEKAPHLSTFVMPDVPLTPPDTHFDDTLPPWVEAWHTRSGHVLVQPVIDGKTMGYMMLDTGASGLVIEEAIANEMQLHAFGEMYVTGMSGSVRCQFRRAGLLKLGPVTIQRPLFMQMSMAGVVAGAPGPVIGILGYDLFRRCVMQLPPSSHDATKSDVPFKLAIYPPSQDLYPQDHRWQSVSMVANLPHVEVSLTVNPDSEPVKALLMLDSGAGGVDAMFHRRAVTELGLVHSIKHGMRTLTGIGGSAVPGMRVKSARLHSMDLSHHQFKAVKCLFTESDGLDLTLYSSGILCGDIMNRCTVVLDYARNRIMFGPTEN